MTTRIVFSYWTNYTDDQDNVNIRAKDCMEVNMRLEDEAYAIHVREVVEKFNEFLNSAGYNGTVTYTP